MKKLINWLKKYGPLIFIAYIILLMWSMNIVMLTKIIYNDSWRIYCDLHTKLIIQTNNKILKLLRKELNHA